MCHGNGVDGRQGKAATVVVEDDAVHVLAEEDRGGGRTVKRHHFDRSASVDERGPRIGKHGQDDEAEEARRGGGQRRQVVGAIMAGRTIRPPAAAAVVGGVAVCQWARPASQWRTVGGGVAAGDHQACRLPQVSAHGARSLTHTACVTPTARPGPAHLSNPSTAGRGVHRLRQQRRRSESEEYRAVLLQPTWPHRPLPPFIASEAVDLPAFALHHGPVYFQKFF